MYNPPIFSQSETETETQREKWHTDISFAVLEKLTISEIRYALSYYGNRRYPTKRGDMIQKQLWKILHELKLMEQELLEEYDAND